MSDTPMLERVARRLCRVAGFNPDALITPPIPPGFQTVVRAEPRPVEPPVPAWQIYRDEARTLLAEMREPDEAMSDAASDRGRLGYDPAPAEVWRVMIDAAMPGDS